MPKPKTIFIFAYYSMKDPVFQSAVMPYFRNFPNLEQFRFVLLTFEQKQYECSRSEKEQIKQELLKENILWYDTKWHSGRFKMIKKAFDFLWGILFSCFLVFKFRAKAVYSEAFPGAIIGHYISIFTFTKHLVHTFEPHADYYIETAVWTEKSWEARVLKYFERKIAARCTYIFTATEGMIDKIKSWGKPARGTECYRVPSCVDLNIFYRNESARTEIRKDFGIKEDEIVLVYLGKFGGYYWDEELFRFFACCEQFSKIKFRYFIFTTEAQEPLRDAFAKANITSDKYLIKKLKREEVAEYLSAADLGISAVRAFPSKRFCSPIKDGEYWACGLPIVIPENVSDDFLFTKEYQLGYVLKDTTDESFQLLLNEIYHRQQNESSVDMFKRTLQFVENDRDVEKYKALYASLFDKL